MSVSSASSPKLDYRLQAIYRVVVIMAASWCQFSLVPSPGSRVETGDEASANCKGGSSESHHGSGEYLLKAGVAQPLQCWVGHKEDLCKNY